MKLIYTLFILILTLTLKAQDPHFSQFNKANMYLNPASVGNLKSWTVNYQFRNQWPKISGLYVTNSLGVQYGFNKTVKGLGVAILNDVTGEGAITSTSLSVPLAFGFNIKDKVDLSIGVQTSFLQKSVDWSSLTFGDEIDNKLGFVGPSKDSVQPNNAVYNIDFSIGMEVKISNLKAGFAGAHILEPNEAVKAGSESKLPFKFSSYLNYDIALGSFFKITPSVLYLQQRDFNALMIATTTSYKFVKIMFGYRVDDAAVFGLAFTTKRLDIGYSYDLTTSKLTNNTGGSHEFGVRFRFGKHKEGDFDKAF
jgi:type IX secretion system PorP/SprF family membrane protein